MSLPSLLSGQKSQYLKKQERKLLYIRAEGKKLHQYGFGHGLLNFLQIKSMIQIKEGL